MRGWGCRVVLLVLLLFGKCNSIPRASKHRHEAVAVGLQELNPQTSATRSATQSQSSNLSAIDLEIRATEKIERSLGIWSGSDYAKANRAVAELEGNLVPMVLQDNPLLPLSDGQFDIVHWSKVVAKQAESKSLMDLEMNDSVEKAASSGSAQASLFISLLFKAFAVEQTSGVENGMLLANFDRFLAFAEQVGEPGEPGQKPLRFLDPHAFPPLDEMMQFVKSYMEIRAAGGGAADKVMTVEEYKRAIQSHFESCMESSVEDRTNTVENARLAIRNMRFRWELPLDSALENVEDERAEVTSCQYVRANLIQKGIMVDPALLKKANMPNLARRRFCRVVPCATAEGSDPEMTVEQFRQAILQEVFVSTDDFDFTNAMVTALWNIFNLDDVSCHGEECRGAEVDRNTLSICEWQVAHNFLFRDGASLSSRSFRARDMFRYFSASGVDGGSEDKETLDGQEFEQMIMFGVEPARLTLSRVERVVEDAEMEDSDEKLQAAAERFLASRFASAHDYYDVINNLFMEAKNENRPDMRRDKLAALAPYLREIPEAKLDENVSRFKKLNEFTNGKFRHWTREGFAEIIVPEHSLRRLFGEDFDDDVATHANDEEEDSIELLRQSQGQDQHKKSMNYAFSLFQTIACPHTDIAQTITEGREGIIPIAELRAELSSRRVPVENLSDLDVLKEAKRMGLARDSRKSASVLSPNLMRQRAAQIGVADIPGESLNDLLGQVLILEIRSRMPKLETCGSAPILGQGTDGAKWCKQQAERAERLLAEADPRSFSDNTIGAMTTLLADLNELEPFDLDSFREAVAFGEDELAHFFMRKRLQETGSSVRAFNTQFGNVGTGSDDGAEKITRQDHDKATTTMKALGWYNKQVTWQMFLDHFLGVQPLFRGMTRDEISQVELEFGQGLDGKDFIDGDQFAVFGSCASIFERMLGGDNPDGLLGYRPNFDRMVLEEPLEEKMGFASFLMDCSRFFRFDPPLKQYAEAVHVCSAENQDAVGTYFSPIHGLTPLHKIQTVERVEAALIDAVRQTPLHRITTAEAVKAASAVQVPTSNSIGARSFSSVFGIITEAHGTRGEVEFWAELNPGGERHVGESHIRSWAVQAKEPPTKFIRKVVKTDMESKKATVTCYVMARRSTDSEPKWVLREISSIGTVDKDVSKVSCDDGDGRDLYIRHVSLASHHLPPVGDWTFADGSEMNVDLHISLTPCPMYVCKTHFPELHGEYQNIGKHNGAYQWRHADSHGRGFFVLRLNPSTEGSYWEIVDEGVPASPFYVSKMIPTTSGEQFVQAAQHQILFVDPSQSSWAYEKSSDYPIVDIRGMGSVPTLGSSPCQVSDNTDITRVYVYEKPEGSEGIGKTSEAKLASCVLPVCQPAWNSGYGCTIAPGDEWLGERQLLGTSASLRCLPLEDIRADISSNVFRIKVDTLDPDAQWYLEYNEDTSTKTVSDRYQSEAQSDYIEYFQPAFVDESKSAGDMKITIVVVSAGGDKERRAQLEIRRLNRNPRLKTLAVRSTGFENLLSDGRPDPIGNKVDFSALDQGPYYAVTTQASFTATLQPLVPSRFLPDCQRIHIRLQHHDEETQRRMLVEMVRWDQVDPIVLDHESKEDWRKYSELLRQIRSGTVDVEGVRHLPSLKALFVELDTKVAEKAEALSASKSEPVISALEAEIYRIKLKIGEQMAFSRFQELNTNNELAAAWVERLTSSAGVSVCHHLFADVAPDTESMFTFRMPEALKVYKFDIITSAENAEYEVVYSVHVGRSQCSLTDTAACSETPKRDCHDPVCQLDDTPLDEESSVVASRCRYKPRAAAFELCHDKAGYCWNMACLTGSNDAVCTNLDEYRIRAHDNKDIDRWQCVLPITPFNNLDRTSPTGPARITSSHEMGIVAGEPFSLTLEVPLAPGCDTWPPVGQETCDASRGETYCVDEDTTCAQDWPGTIGGACQKSSPEVICPRSFKVEWSFEDGSNEFPLRCNNPENPLVCEGLIAIRAEENSFFHVSTSGLRGTFDGAGRSDRVFKARVTYDLPKWTSLRAKRVGKSVAEEWNRATETMLKEMGTIARYSVKVTAGPIPAIREYTISKGCDEFCYHDQYQETTTSVTIGESVHTDLLVWEVPQRASQAEFPCCQIDPVSSVVEMECQTDESATHNRYEWWVIDTSNFLEVIQDPKQLLVRNRLSELLPDRVSEVYHTPSISLDSRLVETLANKFVYAIAYRDCPPEATDLRQCSSSSDHPVLSSVELHHGHPQLSSRSGGVYKAVFIQQRPNFDRRDIDVSLRNRFVSPGALLRVSLLWNVEPICSWLPPYGSCPTDHLIAEGADVRYAPSTLFDFKGVKYAAREADSMMEVSLVPHLGDEEYMKTWWQNEVISPDNPEITGLKGLWKYKTHTREWPDCVDYGMNVDNPKFMGSPFRYTNEATQKCYSPASSDHEETISPWQVEEMLWQNRPEVSQKRAKLMWAAHRAILASPAFHRMAPDLQLAVSNRDEIRDTKSIQRVKCKFSSLELAQEAQTCANTGPLSECDSIHAVSDREADGDSKDWRSCKVCKDEDASGGICGTPGFKVQLETRAEHAREAVQSSDRKSLLDLQSSMVETLEKTDAVSELAFSKTHMIENFEWRYTDCEGKSSGSRLTCLKSAYNRFFEWKHKEGAISKPYNAHLTGWVTADVRWVDGLGPYKHNRYAQQPSPENWICDSMLDNPDAVCDQMGEEPRCARLNRDGKLECMPAKRFDANTVECPTGFESCATIPGMTLHYTLPNTQPSTARGCTYIRVDVASGVPDAVHSWRATTDPIFFCYSHRERASTGAGFYQPVYMFPPGYRHFYAVGLELGLLDNFGAIVKDVGGSPRHYPYSVLSSPDSARTKDNSIKLLAEPRRVDQSLVSSVYTLNNERRRLIIIPMNEHTFFEMVDESYKIAPICIAHKTKSGDFECVRVLNTGADGMTVDPPVVTLGPLCPDHLVGPVCRENIVRAMPEPQLVIPSARIISFLPSSVVSKNPPKGDAVFYLCRRKHRPELDDTAASTSKPLFFGNSVESRTSSPVSFEEGKRYLCDGQPQVELFARRGGKSQ